MTLHFKGTISINPYWQAQLFTFNFLKMNKKEFKAKANQTIDGVSAKIHELKAKKESASGDAKSKYDKAIRDLESKRSDLESKYADLKNASEEKWDEAKDAFSSASDSFKEGFDKLKGLFS